MVVNRSRKRTDTETPSGTLPQRVGSNGNGHIHLNKSTSSSATRRLARTRAAIMLVVLFITAAGSIYLSYGIVMESIKQQQALHQNENKDTLERQPVIPGKVQTNESIKSQSKEGNSSSEINHDKCAFRSYPKNRLYGLLSESQPKFLSEAAYIRGQMPIIINPNENDNKVMANGGSNIQQTSPVKVCLDTTSWENLVDKDGKERLPFTDGQNPSVISLAPNPYSVSGSDNQQHMRLDPKHLEPLASAVPSNSLDSLFLGVSIFGGGQCKFGLSPKDVDTYRFSLYDEPQGGKRAVISVLAPPNSKNNQQSPFETLAQTTLLLERDAPYGTKRKKINPEKTESGFARMHQEFDDPRLFFHLGRVWVLYRNGPLFGYEDQVHNPIHFEKVSPSSEDGVKFVAYVKASETVWLHGGRNIALISEEPIAGSGLGEVEWVATPSLKALTWVDPVTVIDNIDLRGVDAKLNGRRLLEEADHGNDASSANQLPSEYHPTWQHRRLGSKPDKSYIHGTNGYMVPLTSTGELLGIAHFHRPENRKKSDFALHGHHYTHALFTIAREALANSAFKLKRISNEFVFQTNSLPAGETKQPQDGDIIQFASGLDVVGSDVDGQLIVSYGINDCEGAVFTLSMQRVQQMLIGVNPGQEVVDLMENVKR